MKREYRISEPEDFSLIYDDPHGYFILENDIDFKYGIKSILKYLPNRSLRYIDKNTEPIDTSPLFSGVLDGQGHKIKNIPTIKDDNGSCGIFSINKGTIKNLEIENINVEGDDFTGGLVGTNLGNIENCSVNGVVNGGDKTGGLVGANRAGGSISNCSFTGEIVGHDTVGGFAGLNTSLIKSCNSYVEIDCRRVAGGLIGNNDGLIKECISESEIDASDFIGGVAGNNKDTIKNSACELFLENSRAHTGGFVGLNQDTIEDCYWKPNGKKAEEISSSGGEIGDTTEDIKQLNISEKLEKALLVSKI